MFFEAAFFKGRRFLVKLFGKSFTRNFDLPRKISLSADVAGADG